MGGLGPKSMCTKNGLTRFSQRKFRFFQQWSLWSGASKGRVAMSALGSGRACPMAVIAFCPSCRSTAHPQFEL